jgi:hypothetical protein
MMKKTFAFAATLLLASAAYASHEDRWGSENIHSILLEHTRGTVAPVVSNHDTWGSENIQSVLFDVDKPIAKTCYNIRTNGNSDMLGSVLLDLGEASAALGQTVTVQVC